MRSGRSQLKVMSAGRDPAVAAVHVCFAPKATAEPSHPIRRLVPISLQKSLCTDDQKFSRIPEEPHFKGTPVET
jgi:hypothetical protein